MVGNPFVRVQWRLAGPATQAILLVFGYFAVVLIVMALVFSDAQTPAQIDRGYATMLTLTTVGQALFLLLVGPSAVRKAVLRDFQSNMIESHRLTPASNLQIVLGYLFGPPYYTGLLFGLGILSGTFFAFRYGSAIQFMPTVVGGWCAAQVAFLPLAALILSLVVLVALSSAGRTSAVGLLVLMSAAGGAFVLPLLPGAALLLGVLSGGASIGILTRGQVLGGDPNVVAITAALQIAFALLFLTAACRKVRGVEAPAFDVRLGLVLLMATGATLLLGIAQRPNFSWLFRGGDRLAGIQIISAVATFMAIAIFPLSAAATSRSRAWLRVPATGPDLFQPRSAVLVPILLAGLTLLLGAAAYVILVNRLVPMEKPPEILTSPVAAAVAGSIGLSFLTSYFILVTFSLRRFAFLGALFLIGVLIVVPFAIDGVWTWFSEVMLNQRREFTLVAAAFSPLGTLTEGVLYNSTGWIGLGGQGVIALLAWLWATLTARAVSRKNPLD